MGLLPRVNMGVICQHLGVKERDARYVLEQGHVPKGVAKYPASGNYRLFDPGQAFWLAVVLKLKTVGLKTPLAAKVADLSLQALGEVTQYLNLDRGFRPMQGMFKTAFKHYLDVGDLSHIRLATTAHESQPGRLHEFDWSAIKNLSRASKDFRPCVIIRLDLAEISRILAPAFAPSQVPE